MDKKTLSELNALPGWLSLHEGLFLSSALSVLHHKTGAIVEIGSYQGKSTIYLAGNRETVYAIDPHKGVLDGSTRVSSTARLFQKHIREFKVVRYVKLIRKSSSEAVDGWGRKIKFLLIDGLHDEKNANFDIVHWAPFLIKGGIVAMHDSFCGWEGAEYAALNHIVYNNDYYETGVVGSIIYGIKGKSTFYSRINRSRCRFFIRLALILNRQKKVPRLFSFFLIHRLIKLLLINRFILKREGNRIYNMDN